MKNFKTFLQTSYHYTDYQIKVMDYFIKTCLSEISKFMLMGFFFSYFSAFPYYLYATLILWVLRFCSGGLHCKTYIGCLLFSHTYLVLCILVLPRLYLSTIWELILLLMCIVISYSIGDHLWERYTGNAGICSIQCTPHITNAVHHKECVN